MYQTLSDTPRPPGCSWVQFLKMEAETQQTCLKRTLDNLARSGFLCPLRFIPWASVD